MELKQHVVHRQKQAIQAYPVELLEDYREPESYKKEKID